MDSENSKTKIHVLGMTLQQLTDLVTQQAGQPAFRAKQLHHWLYKHGSRSFDEMTNLAKSFRDWLNEHCFVGIPEIVELRRSSQDESVKMLFHLDDGELVESVLMKERDWWTVCVSSQAGCPLGCAFCTTGMGGFRRNLTRAEIVAQVLEARKLVPSDSFLRNIVFMGMGEPLLNYDEVTTAISLITDPDGMAMAARRITLSTSGIVPELRRLFEGDFGIKIAISLSGVRDEERNEIMPIGKKWGIGDILAVCRSFEINRRMPVTFEYVLLGGLNDSDAHALALAKLLRGFPCKINIIPYNPNGVLPYKRPSMDRVDRFRNILLSHNYTCATRISKGLDVDGACGQLAGRHRKPSGSDA